MNEEDIIYILNQSPPDISRDDIINAYELNDKDVMKTILYIWNPKLVEKKEEKPKTKIEECREIADAFDLEMEKYMKNRSKTT